MISRYNVDKTRYLDFSREAIDTFLMFRQGPDDNEAGGILLGKVYPDSRIVVEMVTTPNSYDKAGPYYFDRSRRAAQQAVNRAWEESNGERIYLGEWHSHPVPHPLPSRRDRQMIRNMFLETTNKGVDFLLLVVVGIDENWVGIENGRRLKKLKPNC